MRIITGRGFDSRRLHHPSLGAKREVKDARRSFSKGGLFYLKNFHKALHVNQPKPFRAKAGASAGKPAYLSIL